MIKAIITGSTGMVGEGVLYECLHSDKVESVLVVNRKPCGYSHPKLKEIIHKDFMDITTIAGELKGYNACYFCLGVTSIGKKEEEFTKYTQTLTLHFCTIVAEQNPGITICYISGAGTDSSENGRTMWARVKGRTENAIISLKGVKGFAFRPGFIKPIKGLKYTLPLYKYVKWLYPVGRLIYPNGFCSLSEIGRAMINVAFRGRQNPIVEGKDIIAEAKEL